MGRDGLWMEERGSESWWWNGGSGGRIQGWLTRAFLRIGTLVIRRTGSSLLVVGEGDGGGVCWLLAWRSVPCMLGVWWNVWEERVQGQGVFWEVEERPEW